MLGEATARKNPEAFLSYAVSHSIRWPAVKPKARKIKAWLKYLRRTKLEKDGTSKIGRKLEGEKQPIWLERDIDCATLVGSHVGNPPLVASDGAQSIPPRVGHGARTMNEVARTSKTQDQTTSSRVLSDPKA